MVDENPDSWSNTAHGVEHGSRQELTRRGFIRVAAGGALAASVGLPALLAACGQASPAASSAASSGAAQPAASQAAASSATSASTSAAPAASKPAAGGAAKLPTYMPIKGGPTPDLPGSPDGVVAPGFTAWPKQTYKSVPNPFGDGSDVSIFTNVGAQPPTALDQNAALKAINKDMGVNLKFVITSFADLPVKFATTIAGNDLPDMMTTLIRGDINLVPDLFESKAADLTPYLSGDAIKDYPNLANLPTRSWMPMFYNGKIFGVPQPLSQFFWWPWVHQELLDQAKISQPKTAADFKQMLVAFTKPPQMYGTASQGGYNYAFDLNTGNGWYPSLFGAPNSWAVDSSGKFTSSFETDQYKAALAYTTDLFKAGVFHPDTPTYNVVSARQNAFEARKVLFRFDGLDAAYWDVRGTPAQGLTPPAQVNLLTPFGATGANQATITAEQPLALPFSKRHPKRVSR